MTKTTLRLDEEAIEKLELLKEKTGKKTSQKAIMEAINIVVNDVPDLLEEVRKLNQDLNDYKQKYFDTVDLLKQRNELESRIKKLTRDGEMG